MENIVYTLCTDGYGFDAKCYGKSIGKITFARIGPNKFIIDHTAVVTEFQNMQIGLNLIRHVADLARQQHRKIFPLCPFARAMFNKYPEFDDVRISH